METVEDIIYEAIKRGIRETLDINFRKVSLDPIYEHMSIRDRYSIAFYQIKEEQ